MAHYKGAASESGRPMHLIMNREKAQQEIELRKKIDDDLKIENIESKFAAHYDAEEQQLKTSTTGLLTLEEMKAKQEQLVKKIEENGQVLHMLIELGALVKNWPQIAMDTNKQNDKEAP